MVDDEVFSLHGDEELVARAGHVFASAREEFVCAAKDLRTWAQPHARAAIRRRMPAPHPPGLVTRKLYSPVVLADEDARAHLRELRRRGALVRISGSPLPHETIVIDRRVMILAGRESPAGREYTVTTSRTLVDGVYSLFRAIWDGSPDLDAYLRADVPYLDGDARLIFEALGSGLTDEAAAKRLGVALRTYRRRVAELMVRLDAGSRFQAGLRAGELGLPRASR
ncbi:DNA-binding response regulator [Yinghuangia sp. ASG 101]|nr:DNA-binding response regulator [Yinghuangia sp. ASG 101]UGQ08967.1 DNA-binding response regulator [Yinghuangia sp. ASG 101]